MIKFRFNNIPPTAKINHHIRRKASVAGHVSSRQVLLPDKDGWFREDDVLSTQDRVKFIVFKDNGGLYMNIILNNQLGKMKIYLKDNYYQKYLHLIYPL